MAIVFDSDTDTSNTSDSKNSRGRRNNFREREATGRPRRISTNPTNPIPRDQSTPSRRRMVDRRSQLEKFIDRLPAQANEKQVLSNRRLALVFDSILTPDDVINHQPDWYKYEVHLFNINRKSYIIVDFIKTKTGSLRSLNIGDYEPTHIKTIASQSKWNEVMELIDDQINDDTKVVYPEYKPQWVRRILRMEEKETDYLIHWYYDVNGNSGKTRIAEEIHDSQPDWIVTSRIESACKLLHQADHPRGIILDLDQADVDNPLIYRVIREIRDGRVYYNDDLKRIKPIHVVVLARFKPATDEIHSSKLKLIHIDTDY